MHGKIKGNGKTGVERVKKKIPVRFLVTEGKDRVVHQPGSLNCYETVEEKAFLSLRSLCSSFWKVIVLLSFRFLA